VAQLSTLGGLFMHTPQMIKAAITLIIIAAVSLTFVMCSGEHKCYATSRIKIEDGNGPMFDIAFYRDQYRAISNLLSTSESRMALAKASRTTEQSFLLDKVAQVRGTKLIYIQYAGVDSNIVQSITSNAANIVVSFYATNVPSLQATVTDF
jgi:hypothetical protein